MFIFPEKTQRWLSSGILLAVSGGADSVAMLRFFVENRQPDSELAVAHVNHGLRGKESDDDTQFVRELAEKFDFPYFEHCIEKTDWNADETGSRESAARNLRYEFFVATAERNGLRHIATAHTKNDQVETVLHRILRGTGISGLAGIPMVRKINEAVSLIRPMLHISRDEILEYLRILRQDYRTDSTNKTTEFTRNRIRLKLLPHLREQYNGNVDDAILRLSGLAEEVQAILDEKTTQLQQECVLSLTGREIVLNQVRLLEESPFQVRELLMALWKKNKFPLRRMGQEEWTKLEQGIREPIPSCLYLPDGIEVKIDPKAATVRVFRS